MAAQQAFTQILTVFALNALRTANHAKLLDASNALTALPSTQLLTPVKNVLIIACFVMKKAA